MSDQTSNVTAPDGDADDSFGHVVGLSTDGSTAVIGAPDDTVGNYSDAGSAYVFSNSSGSWRKEAKLSASDGDWDDNFDSAVALSADGSTAALGAPSDEHPNGDNSGSLYIFSDEDGNWTQEAKLATEEENSGSLGISLAASADGSTVIVGAPGSTNTDGDATGAVYVFSETDYGWTQQTKLTAADGDNNDVFGSSVAASNNASILVIGDRWDNTGVADAGSAYIFSGSDGTWTQQTKLTANDSQLYGNFGESISVSSTGSKIICGAGGGTNKRGVQTGAAYVFSLNDGTWSQEDKLSPSDGDEGEKFGSAV